MPNSRSPAPSSSSEPIDDSPAPQVNVETSAPDGQVSVDPTPNDNNAEDRSEAGSNSKQASTSGGSSPQVASETAQPVQPVAPGVASAGDWQAVWSPAHNAYYFYNAKTQETTWVNPLEQTNPSGSATSPSPTDATAAASGSTSTSIPSSLQSLYDLQAAAAAQGIDPSLAHLDPSLAAGPSAPSQFTYTAKFNSRTGAFAKPDARDPTHLSEYERAKRMSEFYFDVGQWEQDVEARKLQEEQEEAEGKKRKRPTKKDLVRAVSLGCGDVLCVCLWYST